MSKQNLSLIITLGFVVLSALALTACGQNESPETAKQGVIPQAQLDAMEKAKAVEDTLKEADQQRRDLLDQQ